MILSALSNTLGTICTTVRRSAGTGLCRLPVRQRYLLTRSGQLRLRYVVPPLMTALLLAGTIFSSAPERAPLRFAENVPPQPIVTTQYIDGTIVPPQKPDRDAAQEEASVQNASFFKEQPKPREKTVVIAAGDTLAAALQRAGVSSNDAHYAVKALEKYFNPRAIKPGQKVWLDFDPAEDAESAAYEFSRMRMNIDPLRTVSLERGDKDNLFHAAVVEKETTRKTYARRTPIELSLFGSALKAGVPSAVISEAIRIFSWDIDFQRDIRRGDVMDVLYDRVETEDGTPVKAGDVLYVRLDVNGTDTAVYRYTMRNGDTDYFTADGSSIRKALMTTPVDGARISSGFGMREHPVLGYTKMHKGVDFAAPRGTPIYAAGDGTIEQMGKNGAYGNYVRIRHNSNIKTAYAHMQKFARGLGSGSRVKQGQIIGYIGSTGRSTGPHLHYEVLMNNAQVNPRSISLPQGEVLKGAELAAFKAQVKSIDHRYESLLGSERYADAGTGKSSKIR